MLADEPFILSPRHLGSGFYDQIITMCQKVGFSPQVAQEAVQMQTIVWLEKPVNKDKFDIAFSSYGAICWISDLNLWATRIASVLKKGGRLVLMEFHPVAMIFDIDGRHKFPYFRNGEPETWEDGVSDYVAESSASLAPEDNQDGIQNFLNPYRSHEFQWGMGEIITALLQAELTLVTFKEYPYSNGWKPFEDMKQEPGRRWFSPENIPNIPLMYSLVAMKK